MASPPGPPHRGSRSRALAIRAPGTQPPSADTSKSPPGSPSLSGKRPEAVVCRNQLQFGLCRKQGKGCPFSHPATASSAPSSPTASSSKALQVKAPVFVPKSANNAKVNNVNAPAFTPQRPFTPDAFTPGPNEFEMPQDMAWVPPAGLPVNGFPPEPDFHGNGHALNHEYFPRQPIYYHLYQGPLPHLSSTNPHQAALASFFISPTLREDLQKRAEALVPSNEGIDIPGYYSLVPLDAPTSPNKDALHSGLGVFNIRNWVYKAFSEKDGKPYVLRRLEGYRLNSRNEGAMIAFVDKWRKLRHPSLVAVIEAFTTKAFGDSSLVFVYDYHPLSSTLYDVHFSQAAHQRQHGHLVPLIPERTLWSYIVQLCNAIKLAHSSGLALRTLEPTKILVTGKERLRVNCCGILDVIRYDQPLTPDTLHALQQEDLFDLGKVILSLACQSVSAIHNLQKSVEFLARTYSPDLQQLCLYLFSKPMPRKGIDDVLDNMVGSWRLLEEVNALSNQNDILESELLRELENARLVRLLAKFGFINERPEFDHDPRWAESGDRYLIKLFRDHVFHQVNPEDGKPVVDLSHVLLELNKLDAGSEDKLMLVSRDGQNCLVVSYREIKNCIDTAFKDLAR